MINEDCFYKRFLSLSLSLLPGSLDKLCVKHWLGDVHSRVNQKNEMIMTLVLAEVMNETTRLQCSACILFESTRISLEDREGLYTKKNRLYADGYVQDRIR